MRKLSISILITAVVLGVIFAGCTQPAPAPTPDPAPTPTGPTTVSDVPELKKYIDMGLMDPNMLMNPFEGLAIKPDGTPFNITMCYLFTRVNWSQNQQGLLVSYMKRAGANFTQFDPDADIQKQVDFIDDQIAIGTADAMLVHAVQEDALAPSIDKAIAAGIPCFATDFVIPSKSKSPCAYHDFDAPWGSEVVGQYFLEEAARMDKPMHILEVWGDRASQSAKDRHKGFRSIVDQSPNITVTETADTMWADGPAFDVVVDNMTADPTINAIYVQGGGATGTLEALRSMDKLHLVGDPNHVYNAHNDIDEAVTQAILDGYMTGSGTHGSYDITDLAVKMIFTQVILGQSVPGEVAVPMFFLTKENAWTPEGTLGGAPTYGLMPHGQWDLWPVLDWSTPGSLIDTIAMQDYQLETPTVELRKQYMGY